MGIALASKRKLLPALWAGTARYGTAVDMVICQICQLEAALVLHAGLIMQSFVREAVQSCLQMAAAYRKLYWRAI